MNNNKINDNKIIIEYPKIEGQKIWYSYRIEGEWKDLFKLEQGFWIEYDKNISSVPLGVAVVPLLSNILPIAWVSDAQVQIPICDKDFYDSIEHFKKGYIEMYPMISFKGELLVGELQDNNRQNSDANKRAASFFSGGVDAFNTLVCHASEKPMLVTLWGADVKLEDTQGWSRVRGHIEYAAKLFDVEYTTIKTQFRYFLNEGKLDQTIEESRDGWWHGFQHGIGIISHIAPIAYLAGIDTVYFASSFTIADKGKATCASDPSIDNELKFCNTEIIHDGYEFNRQMKVHNIVQYTDKNRMKIPIRVCWVSQGGSNCCQCEKCWRTMLALWAEDKDPSEFDFMYTPNALKHFSRRLVHKDYRYLSRRFYKVIQKEMHANTQKEKLPKEIRWFYHCNLDKITKPSVARRCVNKLARICYKL